MGDNVGKLGQDAEQSGPGGVVSPVPSDYFDTPAYLTPGVPFASVIDIGADQMFAIDLVAGASYRFSGGLTLLTLYDDFGPLSSASGTLNFTASSTGHYYLNLAAQIQSNLSYSVSYVRTTAMPTDAVGETLASAGSLQVGGAVQGAIDLAGDSDWYRVQLAAGQSYRFALDGAGASALADPFIQVRNGSDGHVLTFNDDNGTGRNSAVRFTATVTGTYYVSAQAFDTGTGSYSLSVTPVAAQDPLASLNSHAAHLPSDVRVYFDNSGAAAFPAAHVWTTEEIAAAMAAASTYSTIADVHFTRVYDAASANLVMGMAPLGGMAAVTQTVSSSQVAILVDPTTSDWNTAELTPGGGAFTTLVREVGETLGLSHPQDNDAGSEIMEGADQPFGSYGPYLLNQTAFTVMSYNSGYTDLANEARIRGYAYPDAAGPMALDIAAIQSIYGANTAYHSGDDTYLLAGHKLMSIWDTGGYDTISAAGAAGWATIDLRPATLQSALGGGGYLSTLHLAGMPDTRFTIAAGVNIEAATGSNGDDVLIGNDLGNVLTGGAGNDTLDGGSNIDTAVFSGAMSAYTITKTTNGLTVTGPDGTDTLTNVEFLQFSDQAYHFEPGVAASVDFTAPPTTYAAALRDFDGNDLGSGGSWVLAGHVDIQGDGDQEYVLFNRDIGRWATIGPAADGKVYFDDHSWAGDTRVVGTYIDPEVQMGHALQGGPNDSQRRFQNDLNIGNIKGILGAADYNHDGLQEVYFSLADGTAYLHAYMHADGNIEYANYQSQQQVIDYLSGEGFNSANWNGWF